MPAPIILQLANGCALISGWIDAADPDALPAGDYVSLCSPGGDQIYYLDVADVAGDNVGDSRKLRSALSEIFRLAAGA